MSAFNVGEVAEYFMEEDDKGLSNITGWVDCKIIAGPFDDGWGEAYRIQIEGDTQSWKSLAEDLRKKTLQ